LSPWEKALALCQQHEPLPLSSFFTDKKVKSVNKLGEGTFAEVFGYTSGTGKSLAIKIIPIEGSLCYNNEPQTTFQDVLTEMVIMKELSLLGEKYSQENMTMGYFTENFIQIEELALCKGEYPDLLLESWDTYTKTHRTENDRPDKFPSEQLYVLMATENAGTALEDYTFSSVEEALSVIRQIAGALAVGEAALELEHRDLHMSNVLVRKTNETSFLFLLKGKTFCVQSHGVKATIVDYTLSRMRQGECVSFNDLEHLPWLFEGEGDIQFNVYREMKKNTNSHWDQFHPYTNVLWLAYLLAKLINSVKYSDAVSTRSWRATLRPFTRNIYNCSSAQDVFVNHFLSQN
jgi:serine/threonine-protein kinase haspin